MVCTLAITRVKQSTYNHTVLGFTWARGETGGESFLEPNEAFIMIGGCSSLAVLWLAGGYFVTGPFLSASLVVWCNSDWETAVPFMWNIKFQECNICMYVPIFYSTRWYRYTHTPYICKCIGCICTKYLLSTKCMLNNN